MSVSRAEFLKSLGSSVTDYTLGTGLATAQAVAGKVFAMMESSTPTVAAPVKETVPEARVIHSGPETGNQIALTFDDGPTPGVTDRILDELKKRGLHATFFMIGARVELAPDLARRVLAEGHEVGNHTFTHPKLSGLSDVQAEEEVDKTQDVLLNLLGHQATWFRPPYGDLRKNQEPMLAKKGLSIVYWSLSPSDWARPAPAKIIESILEDIKPGSIVVCHDMHRETADCMSDLLDQLLERGLKTTTLTNVLTPEDSK